LTALGLERSAILHHLTGIRQRRHPEGTIYEIGVLACGPDSLQVAVAEIGVGNDGSAIHVERAARFIKPDVVVFLGVAGGLKDVRHGDVVIASKVYGYEPGRAEKDFRTRPVAYPLSHRVEQQVRGLIASRSWMRLLPKGEPDPTAFLGPIAAGEALISSTDSPLYRRIRHDFSDALAVDMEGRGFFAAAHANDSLPGVVVRGISDLIDDKTTVSDEALQPLAARNAAAFLAALLCALVGTETPLELGDTETLLGLMSSLSNAYYLNVPRLLTDPSALGLLSGWAPERLRQIKAWSDLGVWESLELRGICERALENWSGAALPLADAVAAGEAGCRVAFDGRFRTRNWAKFDPEVGLSGDLNRDPLVYTDVAGTRVFMPIDPRWATSSTAQSVFTQGSVSLSGVALLRNVDKAVLASPFVLAPPLAGRQLEAALG